MMTDEGQRATDDDGQRLSTSCSGELIKVHSDNVMVQKEVRLEARYIYNTSVYQVHEELLA